MKNRIVDGFVTETKGKRAARWEIATEMPSSVARIRPVNGCHFGRLAVAPALSL